jgi:hypothetical protein
MAMLTKISGPLLLPMVVRVASFLRQASPSVMTLGLTLRQVPHKYAVVSAAKRLPSLKYHKSL